MKRRRIPLGAISDEMLTLKPKLHFFDDLRDGIITYISERYLGAFVIEEGKALSGYVSVAHDALCYFVRLLLNDLFGQTLLRISYGQLMDEHAFFLRFTYDKSVVISEKERYKLLYYAKYSKAKLDYEETETDAIMTLKMPSRTSLFHCVYTPLAVNYFFMTLSDIYIEGEEEKNCVIHAGPLSKKKLKSK